MAGDEEPKSERFNMFISKSELDAIDEWSWRNRVRSKSDAVRRLVQMGLLIDSVLPALVSNVRDGASHTQVFDEALDRWAASKGEEFGVRQHLLFDDETAAEFRRAYGRLLDDGSQRATMIFGLVERLADVTKADADIEAVVKDIARVRAFYAERAAEVAGQRPAELQDGMDDVGNNDPIHDRRNVNSHNEKGVAKTDPQDDDRTGNSRFGKKRHRNSDNGEDRT